MKRIDFANGTVTGNILAATLPMLVAQILNLLYNIVDRVYIARIPEVGTAALGAVGLCFPLIVIITAFANLFGSDGAPLFSIYRGKKQENTAVQIMDTSFSMLCTCGAHRLSVAIGAVANLLMDPLFIFVLGFGVQGAAIATILSQSLSAAFVLFFLTKKAELRVRFLRKNEFSTCTGHV